MTTPNKIVEAKGEDVLLTRVTDYTAGRDGVEDVTREVETTKAVVHNPTESQQQRLEGRLNDGSISVTFVSGTDVDADRNGGRDRLIRPDPEIPPGELSLFVGENTTTTVEEGETTTTSNVLLEGNVELNGTIELTGDSVTLPDGARVYTAIDVTRDKHALVGIEKLTVVYNEFGGRTDLSEDASQYVEA